MNKSITTDLLHAITDVLQVMKADDLIRHLTSMKGDGSVKTMQSRIIDQIINETCREIDVDVSAILLSKLRLQGRRIKAYAIISAITRSIYPKVSFSEIREKLHNNVSKTNLSVYTKQISNIKPDTIIKEEQRTLENIVNITNKVLSYIQDNSK